MTHNQKIEARKDLPFYYQLVRNKRTGYTKLVTSEKAAELLYGRLVFGVRHKNTKDEYTTA